MVFIETSLKGAFVVEPQKLEDERGYFARSWCRQEFLEHGLEADIVQCNISFNKKKGTLRGMHYQLPPFAEAKVVRCVRGALFDVIIDLRPTSPTFLKWISVELAEASGRMLYIPKLFAHGFQTLRDETEVSYLMSEIYSPDHARGIRWDDPQVQIVWPEAGRTISQKDRTWEDFDPERYARLVSSGADGQR